MLTIALPKGRLGHQTSKLLNKAIDGLEELDLSSRKLVLNFPKVSLTFILVKPSDVPTYVEYGVADVGIAGKDTLLETQSKVYEMLDLGFGKCKMVVAGFPHNNSWINKAHRRVSTKYPNIAKSYFSSKGETAEIVKLNGSVELGPIVGLSDVIVDIVESGNTLKENGLVVLEEICDISARLIVNRVSLKTKRNDITRFIGSIEKVLEEI
ncbi:MAG: ATP phosphoribosyltransferase [Clostridiales bacterium]|nr:ATP phosphoribosyltransferase [Clostridiales bacterium]